MTDDVHDRLQRVMRDVFDDDALVARDQMSAADVPDWDSLAHVSLVVAVEKEFKVRFAAHEVSSLRDVGELKTLIRSKLAR